jgi:hypothetical protein
MVVHVYNPDPVKTEAGGSKVLCQSRLQSETLTPKKNDSL